MKRLEPSFPEVFGVTPNRVWIAWLSPGFLYSRGYLKSTDRSESFGAEVFTPFGPRWFAADPPLVVYELAYLLGRDNPAFGEYGSGSATAEMLGESALWATGLARRDLPWLPDTSRVWGYFPEHSSNFSVNDEWGRSLSSGSGNAVGRLGLAVYAAIQQLLPTEGGALLTFQSRGVWPQTFQLDGTQGTFIVAAADGTALVFPRRSPELTLDELRPILSAAAAASVAGDPGGFASTGFLQAETASAAGGGLLAATVDAINERIAGEKPWLDPDRAWCELYPEHCEGDSSPTATAWGWVKLLAFGFLAYSGARLVSALKS